LSEVTEGEERLQNFTKTNQKAMFIRQYKLGRIPSKSNRAIMDKITWERIKSDDKGFRSSALWCLSLLSRFHTFRRKWMPSSSGSRLSDDETSCTRRTESSSTSLPKLRDWQIEDILTEATVLWMRVTHKTKNRWDRHGAVDSRFEYDNDKHSKLIGRHGKY